MHVGGVNDKPVTCSGLKTLDDGTYMLALGHGNHVILLHYIVTRFEVIFRPMARRPDDWAFDNSRPEFEPRLENQLLNSVLISRKTFEAGGYENKVYERDPARVAQQALLSGPEG